MKRIFSELRLYICNNIISHFPSNTVRLLYYRHVMNFNIGKGSNIFMGCKFDSSGNLSIGENSVINAFCRIDTRGKVVIGSNVSISEEVILLTADHDMDKSDMEGRNGAIIIEDYVWIGTRAMILPNVTINYAGVVAASALVTKNVLSYNVVAGVPAKFIKERQKHENFTYTASYKRLFQ